MKETYERSRITMTLFGRDDVIAASDPVRLVFSRDEYEGHVMKGER